MTSDQIKKLLAAKHSDDVFMTEVKDGATQTRQHVRLDAWAMKKSWADPRSWGYEIKVSRSDFKGDDKFHRYLPLCTQFYFVCPWGMIQPEELQAECGLLWVAKTENRLWEKKRAPYRAIELPESLYRYVLMCRTSQKHDTWSDWLKESDEHAMRGHVIAERIARLTKLRVHEIEAMAMTNERREAKIKEVEEVLRKAGINPYSYDPSAEAQRFIENRKRLLPDDLLLRIEGVQRELGKLLLEANGKHESR